MDKQPQDQPPTKPNDSDEPDKVRPVEEEQKDIEPESPLPQPVSPQDEETPTPQTEAPQMPKPKPMNEFDVVQGQEDQGVVPMAGQPKKPKKGLVALIIALVVILLGVAGWLTYAFWYQNPEKVVTDGIVHALQAKTAKVDGSATLEATDEYTLTVDFSASARETSQAMNAKLTFKSADAEFVLDGEAIASGGNFYIKIRNVEDIVNSQMGITIPKELESQVNAFVAKINDRWIKISADDMAGTDLSTEQKCFEDAYRKFQSDNTLADTLSKIYKENKFIIVAKELGSQNGSLGYALSADREKAKTFVNAFKETEVYKTLHGCDESFELNADDLTGNDGDTGTYDVSVWVSRWTHQITKIDLLAEDEDKTNKLNASFNTMFDVPVEIAVPADADTLSLEEVTKEIEELYTAIYLYSFTGTLQEVEGATSTEL